MGGGGGEDGGELEEADGGGGGSGAPVDAQKGVLEELANKSAYMRQVEHTHVCVQCVCIGGARQTKMAPNDEIYTHAYTHTHTHIHTHTHTHTCVCIYRWSKTDKRWHR